MFLSNRGDYSRDGYYTRKYGNFKYKKKDSFHSMETIKVEENTIRLTKKGTLITD